MGVKVHLFAGGCIHLLVCVCVRALECVFAKGLLSIQCEMRRCVILHFSELGCVCWRASVCTYSTSVCVCVCVCQLLSE